MDGRSRMHQNEVAAVGNHSSIHDLSDTFRELCLSFLGDGHFRYAVQVFSE